MDIYKNKSLIWLKYKRKRCMQISSLFQTSAVNLNLETRHLAQAPAHRRSDSARWLFFRAGKVSILIFLAQLTALFHQEQKGMTKTKGSPHVLQQPISEHRSKRGQVRELEPGWVEAGL